MKSWGKGGGIDLDRSREFRKQDYPHQPHKYHLHIHFLQRFKQPDRFLNSEAVRRSITCGLLKNAGSGCAAFYWSKFGGVKYCILAGYHQDGYRIVFSGYPYVANRSRALNWGWTEEQLDTIKKNEKSANKQASNTDYADWLQQDRAKA